MNPETPVLLPLSGKRGGIAIIEWQDWPRVAAHPWHVGGRYVQGRPQGAALMLLHRYVVEAQPGQVVAHLNGDFLDCRRANLLVTGQATNMMQRHSTPNRPRLVGVHRCRTKWAAMCHPLGVHRNLGLFSTPEEAALVRDFFVRCRLGCLATYNYPVPPELAYVRHGWREPPGENGVSHPAALLALRMRRVAAAAWPERTIVRGFCAGGEVMVFSGAAWGPSVAGTGIARLETGTCAFRGGNVCGARTREAARAVMQAIGRVVREGAWCAFWKRDGKHQEMPLW